MKLAATSALRWILEAVHDGHPIEEPYIRYAEQELRKIVDYTESLERQLDKIRKVLDGEL